MPTFQYVSPSDGERALMQVYRDKYQLLYEDIKSLPSSRGVSIALTKLEESGMWLNKAISGND